MRACLRRPFKLTTNHKMNPSSAYTRENLTAVFRSFLPAFKEALGPDIGPRIQGRRTVARHGTDGRVLYWSFWDSCQRDLGIDSIYFTYAVSYDPVRFELDHHDWALVLHLNTVRSYYGPFPLRNYLAKNMEPAVPQGFQWQIHPRLFRVIREFPFDGRPETLPSLIREPLTRLVKATHPVLARMYAQIAAEQAKGAHRAADVPNRPKATGVAANPARVGEKSEWTRAIPAALRDAVLERHGWVCHLCQQPIRHPDDLHIDHLVPWAQGGKTTLANLRPAHSTCNLEKGAGGKSLPPEQRSPAKRRPPGRR